MLLAHDHSDLDALLAQFFHSIAAGNVAQSFDKLDLFWARLAVHIRAEHLHLFPALLHALESRAQTSQGGDSVPSLATVQDTIARLREDHDFFMIELAAAVKNLHQLRQSRSDDQSSVLKKVEEKIVAVSERLRVHNELEESQVYPWAGALLAPAQCVALNETMQKELASLPSRFEQSTS
jgi:hypothetical protein